MNNINRITCPRCGAECYEIICNKELCTCGEHKLCSIPQPDLTKLREIYDEYSDLSGPCMRNEAYPIIMKAIKEILSIE